MSHLKNWILVGISTISATSVNSFAQNINKTQYLTIEQAQNQAFPGAKLTPKFVNLTHEQMAKIHKDSHIPMIFSEVKMWEATSKNGQKLGIFAIDRVYGKHEFITYSIALNERDEVMEIEILEYIETYGEEVEREDWRRQFRGKKYGDAFTLERDIKNISGATLSCKHISDGVKRFLAFRKLFGEEK